jgi:hypothetical protein
VLKAPRESKDELSDNHRTIKLQGHPMKTFAALLTAFSLLTATRAHADTVVVTADRMLDVIAGRIVERPQITITDGRISAVAAQGSPVAPGARRIDLQGMTLLPGLIDMHVHLTSDPRPRHHHNVQPLKPHPIPRRHGSGF